MITRIFRDNSFSSLIAIFFMLALVYVSGYFSGPEAPAFPASPAFQELEYLLQDFPWLSFSISFLLIASTMLLINYFCIQLNLYDRPNYLPGFLFGMIYCSHPANLQVNEFLPAAISAFLIWVMLNPEVDGSVQRIYIFNAGLFNGVVALFYFPAVYWLPFIVVSMVIFNVVSARKSIIALIGFLVPWLYAFTYLYWFDQLDTAPGWEVLLGMKVPSFPASSNREVSVLVSLAVLVLIIFVSVSAFLLRYFQLKILQRRRYFSLLVFGGFVLVTGFHYSAALPQHLYIMSFALAIFAARFFLQSKKAWIDDLLLGSFILMIFINHWVRFLA